MQCFSLFRRIQPQPSSTILDTPPVQSELSKLNKPRYERSRYHVWCLLGVFVLCFLGLLLLANTENIPGNGEVDYIYRLSYLEDVDARLAVEDVVSRSEEFNQTNERSLNFGLSESVYWVWVKMLPTGIDSQALRLELGYPHLDYLDVYSLINNVPALTYQLGDMVSFGGRPVKDRTFVLPVKVQPDGQPVDFLFRVQSKGSIQLPVHVSTETQYQLGDRDEQLVLGFYYGILLGVLAYNLLLAFGTREPVYGYYCAYAVFLTLFQFSQNGLAFEYLWQKNTHWHQLSIPFFASMALLFCTRFTQVFLNLTRKNSPGLYWAYQLVVGMFAALALATFVADRSLIITLVSIAVSLAGVFMISTSYYLYLKGDDNAFYYLLAWTILLFGIVIYATKTLGLVPESFITEYSVQIGSAIEMILLSYALADRFNRLRDENIRVQAEAKAGLETRVEQRTRELQQALIQFEAANDQLASLSQRDPMTGLYNRRYFNEVFEKMRSKMARQSKPLSLMMIDIDHFKSINDTRGHLIGDQVICDVAGIVESAMACEECVPVRFGGEEFVALLPGYSHEDALAMAEALRESVESVRFRSSSKVAGTNSISDGMNVSGNAFTTSVSIGVTVELPAEVSGQTGLKLLEQADQALYAAKESGRNRCVLYQPG